VCTEDIEVQAHPPTYRIFPEKIERRTLESVAKKHYDEMEQDNINLEKVVHGEELDELAHKDIMDATKKTLKQKFGEHKGDLTEDQKAIVKNEFLKAGVAK